MFRLDRSLIVSLGLLSAASLMLLSCGQDYRGFAVGETGSLVVVMDSSLWRGSTGDATRAVFEELIETFPVQEPAFAVEYVDLRTREQFEKNIRTKRYLLFAGVLDVDNNVSRFIQSRLDTNVQALIRGGEPGIYQLQDVWMRDQLVYYLAATSDSSLADAIHSNGASIRYNLNEANRRQMEEDMFSRYRQTDVEKQMMERHGFAVNVQHDYLTAVDTTGFVWLRRFVDQQNWRSVFIYYVDQADPTTISPEWVLEARDRLTETWITGNLGDFVRIDRRRPITTEEINFLGRYGLETRGLWHLVGYDHDGTVRSAGGGGPFLSYTFYDEEQGRLYLIDGMIFGPKYDKRELLRQIEVIAHTFRTQAEEAQSLAESVSGH